MKALIIAAGALAVTTAAHAQTVIKEQEAGVYSAPVAGATPQARERPAPDTTMMEKRTTTTVIDEPKTQVIEERPTGAVRIETAPR